MPFINNKIQRILDENVYEAINTLKKHFDVLNEIVVHSKTLENEIPREIENYKNYLLNKQLENIKIKSLTIYRDILLKLYENKPIYDFYTNELLNPDNISIDHFIPWSYIYSDDIWNLVITSKSNNSRKSNKLSSKVFLKKIIEQNQKLIELIKDDSLRDTIKEAIDHHYIEKFYNDLATI